MQYRTLGQSDLQVSAICFGAAFRSGCDEATAVAAIRRAADFGCNYLDTANIYRGGFSEIVVGKAIAGRREQFIVSTKAGGDPATGGPHPGGLTRTNIVAQIEGSLRRLNTDYVDSYLCHFPDQATPIDETLGALDQLVRQGKTRTVGCANFPPLQLREALDVSAQLGLSSFVCDQTGYNFNDRSADDELAPLCIERGVSLTVYAATAIGLFSGQYRYGRPPVPPPPGSVWHRGPYNFRAAMTEQTGRIIDALIDIAERHDKTPVQVALAWCLRQPAVTSVIIGVDNAEQAEEDFGAGDWILPDDCLAQLNDLSANMRLATRKDCPEGYDNQSVSE